MLEAYFRGLRGVTRTLSPYSGKYACQTEGNKIGMTITFPDCTYTLGPAVYKTANELHGIMWSFAEWVYEEIEKGQPRKSCATR